MSTTDPESPRPTYSVSWRLQRQTTEFAFVSVPVTADLIIEQPDGTGKINVEKMVQRAIEMGQASNIEWQLEVQTIQPHPIQTPRLDAGPQNSG